jgi:hypothetical protein
MNPAAALQVLAWATISLVTMSCSAVNDGGVAASPRVQSGAANAQQRVTGEYIVTLRQGADEAAVRELFSAFDVQELSTIGGQQRLLKVRKDPGSAVMQSKAAESPAIEAIQPNFIYRQHSEPGVRTQ